MRIAEKEQVVEQLGRRVREAKCLYVTDFTGLDVATMTELRRRLAEAEVEYVVVKNTLARRALQGSGFEALVDQLEGANAFAVSHSDVVAAAKILSEFERDKDKPKIKAGVIEGAIVSTQEIRRIASLPPREVLLAQIMGSARAPMVGLVGILHGLLAKFVRTVDAVRASKEAAGGAEAPAPAAEPSPTAELSAEVAEPSAEPVESSAEPAEPSAEPVESSAEPAESSAEPAESSAEPAAESAETEEPTESSEASQA